MALHATLLVADPEEIERNISVSIFYATQVTLSSVSLRP